MKDNRRTFIKKAALGTTGITLGASSFAFSAKSYNSILGANDRINMCVIGTRGQGFGHLKRWASMAESENVHVKTICDVDENLWAERVTAVEEIQGKKPGTEVDMRKVFDDKDIHAVSIATPNHWHALATIWAVQAGKDVYVEKPCSHNVFEGRKMIDAARKYNRVVQVGFQNRSIENVRKAMQFLHNGGIGDVYMAKGLCYKPRDSFGIAANSEPPQGFHYDLWLGPAPMRPYNEKKSHYNWHWHWDTGNGDIGNQGPHQFDVARWGMNKNEHPVKVSSSGGYYKYTKEQCSQETANTQTAVLEYADGKILQFEVRGLSTGGEAPMGIKIGNLFYGTEGWMEVDGGNWKTYMGPNNEPGPSSESQGEATDQVVDYLAAPGGGGHYSNFIAAVRSGNKSDLTCDIEEGYHSTVLPLLSNISYRLGRNLEFDGKKEKFVKDAEADKMLSREYRKPYVVENNV
ncbi:Gfo/Idh/MocA family protein [Catalinimonas niigatensis]|uniref:Gfo/Idh/MocA family protein n=1 Tax=Catalinimonas niigatensis TaxID=1397264 RepID=UPI002666B694|nr:Gfo/Idh/MocA family oxidoreductase [Catalinimonas niigatensis]WPP50372.1 Gfo/Idh/MocA family oxidoreductase [Catalinimonas niigatensis]